MKYTMTIDFDSTTGETGISGPLQLPLICTTMLEEAKWIVYRERFKQEAQPQKQQLVVVPGSALPPSPPGM